MIGRYHLIGNMRESVTVGKAGNQMQRIVRAVAAACAPLGIKKHEIVASARSIAIPSCGIAVSAELSDGMRVWRASRNMQVASVTGEGERSVSTVLFEEPFERELQVARQIALQIAEFRIDAAIDEAVASS
jgi:hypothetical protein